MSQIFTRVQNEKLIAAQKDITSSITGKIDDLFKNAYAVQVSTNGDQTYLCFQIQNEDGTITNKTVKFSSTLFSVK